MIKPRASPIKVSSPLKEHNENASKHIKQVTDSGYHGMTEDEMDTQEDAHPTAPVDEAEPSQPTQVDSAVDVEMEDRQMTEERRTTEGSFHSARENMTTRDIGKEIDEHRLAVEEQVQDAHPVNPAPPPKPAATGGTNAMDLDEPKVEEEKEAEQDLGGSPSSSDASTPDKPMVRKSSLTLPSLPAREPRATKMSFGNRVSRTSQLETSKNTALSGGSYFGRYTGGKSLGAPRQASDDDAMDVDESKRPELSHEESDGDGKIAQMHNKSSTQRLQERINLLGKTRQPPRPTKSIPAAVLPAQQAQPEAQKVITEIAPTQSEQPPKSVENHSAPIGDDDDDWIIPPSSKPKANSRPQLSKSRSVDVMEQLNGKDTIGGAQLGMGPTERDQAVQQSPLRAPGGENEVEQDPGFGLRKAISTTILASPSRPMHIEEPAQIKPISVSNPPFRPTGPTTPPGSPPKFNLDGHLSASKSKMQSILKSARGLFTSSAGASAQAKMETLSPGSLRLRLQEQRTIGGIDEVMSGVAASSNDLYPSLPKGLQSTSTESPSKGRKTRSSTEKEEKRKEKEAKDRERAEAELEKAREQERRRAAKYKEQMNASAAKAINRSVEDVASLEKASKPIRQSPRRLAKEDSQQEAASQSAQQMPPPTRPTTAGSQIAQKPKEIRRIMKPAKEAATKPKQPPVSIRVGTMSQRVNNTLSNNLQETLGQSQQRPTGLTKKGSNASIQTMASNSSFKSSSSSQTGKPKALIAAERKKEQDEREAQRKAEQKRELERKRAAAQEEAQKREQKQREEAERVRETERALAAEQEAKKQAHKQAVEKRRLEMMKKDQQRDAQRAANDLVSVRCVNKMLSANTVQGRALETEKSQQPSNMHRADLGSSRAPSKMDKIQDFPRPPGGLPAVNPAKPPIKRVFDPDNDDELSRPARGPQAGQNYKFTDGKRRKTDEDDFVEQVKRPTMAPPIRQSAIRKMQNATAYGQTSTYKSQEPPKPSAFHNNYPAAPPAAHGQVPSVFKSSMSSQSYQQYPHASQANRPGHPTDMAKYTNGKIPFADAPNPPGASYKTPHTINKMPPPSTAKSSPGFINGEHIHLDDIPTDSDEEDSEDERNRKSSLPDWVRTPNLYQNLSDQERLNPDAVFGPIAPLNMEEMFKDKRRHDKFRARTSSANWFGNDRLTEEDIRLDNAAREKLRKDGGWTYGLGGPERP